MARTETNTQLRVAKNEYYTNKISCESQNPKTAWKTINSGLIGKQNRSTKVNELNIDNVKLTYPEDIAKGFNDYFANIGYIINYEYLSLNNLSEHQFGFQKFQLTASALLDCTNDWNLSMDRKWFNLAVY
ncbi:Hypothetical predicted protein [Paramuricea clavata]|uniref:Uncharacterized protein n=1 Tax=Paramuricea clavata TaxID=317549 RepID=A0A6S7GMU6_PARCT|nr:Hypothetical predicted protein [Paramuricea clavata]